MDRSDAPPHPASRRSPHRRFRSPLRHLLDFSPAVRGALRIDVSAALLAAVFTAFTTPFSGLVLRRELGATPAHLSVLASAGAACLLLSLVLTRLGDGRPPLARVVWPTGVARGLFVLVPLIATPWPLVGVIAAGTLASAVAGPAQAALVQQVYPRAERGRALGLARTAAALLGIGLAPAAGALCAWIGYRWVFCLAGLFGIAASLRQSRLPVPAAPAAGGAPPGLGEAWAAVRGDLGYRRLLLASFVFGSGIWLQMPATPLLLADVLHATTAQVGGLAAAGAAAALGGNLVWGRLVDGRSSLRALRAVYLLGALTPLVYFSADAPGVLVVAAVGESLMHTGLDLVWMLAVLEFSGPRRAAQYAAIGATLAGVRGVIGPLAGAVIIEALGVRAVYVVAAALMGAGAAMVSWHLRDQRRAADRTVRRALQACGSCH